jgi:hypothetical protein
VIGVGLGRQSPTGRTGKQHLYLAAQTLDGTLSDAIPGIGPSGASRATRFAPGETVSLPVARRRVDYAFTVFHSVRPAIAVSRRPRYEKR